MSMEDFLNSLSEGPVVESEGPTKYPPHHDYQAMVKVLLHVFDMKIYEILALEAFTLGLDTTEWCSNDPLTISGPYGSDWVSESVHEHLPNIDFDDLMGEENIPEGLSGEFVVEVVLGWSTHSYQDYWGEWDVDVDTEVLGYHYFTPELMDVYFKELAEDRRLLDEEAHRSEHPESV